MSNQISTLHFLILFFNIQIFLPSTCTITIPIRGKSAMKLLWKTNALSPLVWTVQKPFTHQYSSSRYAKGGCLLGGCSARSQNLHAPHPEAQFFLWGILVHLHKKAKFLYYWYLLKFCLLLSSWYIFNKIFIFISSFAFSAFNTHFNLHRGTE